MAVAHPPPVRNTLSPVHRRSRTPGLSEIPKREDRALSRFSAFSLYVAIGLCASIALGQQSMAPVKAFPTQVQGQIRISREAIPELPFSVVGPRGALLGQQDGAFEMWLFPWKIFDQMHIEVNMQDYPVPIQVN